MTQPGKRRNRQATIEAAFVRVSDYVPSPQTTAVALARTAGNAEPGYENPAVTSKDLSEDMFASHGATGTLFLAGIIANEEYNADLAGDNLLQVTDRMWRSDGQAQALLNVLTLPLTSAEKTIEPASDAQQDVDIAQFVQDNLFGGMDHTFSETDEYVTRVWLRDGFGILEKVYVKSDDGMIRLRKLAQRLNKTIYRWYPDDDDNLDRIQQRVWVTDANGITGQYRYPVIPASKLVRFTHMQEGNNFAGTSIYRAAYKHWYIKDQLERIQAVQAERMAVGVPHFSEPMGPVQKSDRDRAAAIGASLHAHQNAYVISPHGWGFDFVTPSGAAMDLTPAIEYHSLQMVRAVLAQFLNLDRGGSYALSMDISTFFTASEESRATYLEDQWTAQVIKPLVDLNFPGVTRYPKLTYSRIEKRDVDKFLVGLAAVLPWLTKDAATENAVRELLQLPDLPPEATPAGGGDPTVETSGSGESADPQAKAKELDETTTQAAQDKNQPAAEHAPTTDTALSRLPDDVRDTVAALLREPHPGLSEQAYRDIVWAQVDAVLSEASA